MYCAPSSFIRASIVACTALLPVLAQASGPTERVLEVLPHPTDANVIIARYGVPGGASNGFLYSSDGGQTFKAGCSDLITTGLKLQRSLSPYVAAVHLDAMGRLTISQDADEVYVGDTTGCSFTKSPGFEKITGYDLAADPSDENALYMLANRRTDDGATSELMRRDASGTWTTIGAIKPPAPGDSTFGSDLAVAKLPDGGTRVVVFYTFYQASNASDTDLLRVGISDDGGKTWTEHKLTDPPKASRLRLLAIDPTNPDRVLAVEYAKGPKDKLLLSTDKGATYAPWAEVDEFSGLAFDSDGRLYISSTRDAAESTGGLYTAAKMGEPLMRLPESSELDCVAIGPDGTMFGCSLHTFGTLDPSTGKYTEVTRLERVQTLIECDGKDVKNLCEAQLNSGGSWCCAGHFPFTPICEGYDVTRTQSGSPVLCGKSGQDYDRMAGRGPGSDGGASDAGTSPARDAGTGGPTKLDAGTADPGKRDAATEPSDDGDDGDEDDDVAAPPSGGGGGDDGCSLSAADSSSSTAAFALFGVALSALLRRRRRAPRD